MELRFVTFVLCSLLVPCTRVESSCRDFFTITNNLREVVIGNCEFFQQTISQEVFCREGFRNCTAVWEALGNAFLNKSQCHVPAGTYDEFINLTDHSIPRDKLKDMLREHNISVIWSHVFKPSIAICVEEYIMRNVGLLDYWHMSPNGHFMGECIPVRFKRYSNQGRKMVALSDTLAGYIGDGPSWCSDPSTPDGLAAPGTLCPGWYPTPDCPQSASFRFWVAASRRYAEKASGVVYVMLNARVVPIYGNTSYLAVFELPFLRTGIVTKVTVLLINERPTKGSTKCDDPSLQLMVDQMTAKNISYDCVENQRDVADLLCLQDSSLGLCVLTFETSSAVPPAIGWTLLLLVMSVRGLFHVERGLISI